MKTCPHCGCSEIDEDAARGDATCTGCGTVLEESIVVSENQFQERSGGSGHTLVGQFVSADRAASHNVNGFGGQESREVTYQRGRKVIEEIASQLRINQHCIDTSYTFFKMCVSRNLTRGRMRVNVVASCMYMTCRIENTGHLLLDFSDVTQINVFDLGRTLSFLTRSLRINLPATDPCLYIMRFACMLEFGDKQKEVVTLANRLVQRMKRDWMSTGRRPTGICGAALLIAARSLNFNRTISDVVRVVHISESVVRKRLDEFSQTPSGSLTIDEFSTIELEHCEDPPAYREARRKAREDQIRREAEQAEKFEKDLQPMEVEVEKALEKKRREKFSKTPYAKLVVGDIEGVGKAEEDLVRSEVMASVYEAAEMPEPCCSTSAEQYEKYGPSLKSLGILQPHEKETKPNAKLPEAADGELELDDISDSEIESYILTDQESLMKERYWMKTNGEVMQMLEQRKREREEQDGKEKDNHSKKKRKPRPRFDANGAVAATAIDAMEKVIHEKKLSNKVNYVILKEIETTGIMPHGRQQQKPFKEEEDAPSLTDNSMDSPSMGFAMGYGALSQASLTKQEKSLARNNARRQATTRPRFDVLRNAFGVECSGNVKNEPTSPMKAPKDESASSTPRRLQIKPNISSSGQKSQSGKDGENYLKEESRGTVEKSPDEVIPMDTSDDVVFVNPKTEELPKLNVPRGAGDSVKTSGDPKEGSATLLEEAKPVKSRYGRSKPNIRPATNVKVEPPNTGTESKLDNNLPNKPRAKANIPEELLRRSTRR